MPRYDPCTAVINGELYMWGGKMVVSTSQQVYHPYLESWRQLTLRAPHYPDSMAVPLLTQKNTSMSMVELRMIYHSGCLHKLDIKTSTWILLAAHSANAPMKKVASGMIVYDNSVIIIGGYGIRNGPIQPGSKWICKDDDGKPNTKGSTNEIHKYDLSEGEGVNGY